MPKNIYMFREDKLIGRKYKCYAKYNKKLKFTNILEFIKPTIAQTNIYT